MYIVLGKKTNQIEDEKPQAVTVIVVCNFFLRFKLASDWPRHYEHSKHNF